MPAMLPTLLDVCGKYALAQRCCSKYVLDTEWPSPLQVLAGLDGCLLPRASCTATASTQR
eukprot:6177571-Pleurochrysis_carterae.AAC.1